MKTPDMGRRTSPEEEIADVKSPEKLLGEISQFGMDLRDEALSKYGTNFVSAMEEATTQINEALAKHQGYMEKVDKAKQEGRDGVAETTRQLAQDFLDDEMKRIKQQLRLKISRVN